MPINSGTYKFSSVLTFFSVSVTVCAQFCIEQQGNACQGFYFCDQTMSCYLTSIQSGAGQQQVQNDTSDGATFCNYYNSKIYKFVLVFSGAHVIWILLTEASRKGLDWLISVHIHEG